MNERSPWGLWAKCVSAIQLSWVHPTTAFHPTRVAGEERKARWTMKGGSGLECLQTTDTTPLAILSSTCI